MKTEGLSVMLTGSGAPRAARALGLPFCQEVVSAAAKLRRDAPDVDCAVELGGEDAKLLYLKGSAELRMNEACAGGTGAFFDQMASLLSTDTEGLSRLAEGVSSSRPIASRCGVFAKTDVVSLLNAGVSRNEISRSIFDAVAQQQTLGGLACGRPLQGIVELLGGPLAFLPALRENFRALPTAPGTRFAEIPDAALTVAGGAALEGLKAARESCLHDFESLLRRLGTLELPPESALLGPLFALESDVAAFQCRHARTQVRRTALGSVQGDLFLGIDLGSTTVKGAVIDGEGRLAHEWYDRNEGRPLEKFFARLKTLLAALPEGARLRAACTTGYGAELAQAAASAQFTEVETLAHQRGAAFFDPGVSCVIDIGGQDIKCLFVRDGLTSAVTLNEACSSGCGSFLQTFADQLGMPLTDFVATARRATTSQPAAPRTDADTVRREGRTLYAPQMAPIHFSLIAAALQSIGWRVSILPEVTSREIDLGLRHVNNDACYPAVVAIGHLDLVRNNSAFDPAQSALLLAQTCGPCRASNYPSLLKWALKEIGAAGVPVLSLTSGGLAGDAAIRPSLQGLRRLMTACVYGDLMLRLSFHVRAHETVKGTAERLLQTWSARAAEAAAEGAGLRRMAADMRAMVKDFLAVPTDGKPRPRIGIAGEILLKYHPAANLGIVGEIIEEGTEPVLGDLAAFFLYCLNDRIWQVRELGGKILPAAASAFAVRCFELLRRPMRDALAGTPLAGVPTLGDMLKSLDGLVSPGQQAGEGWLLTAEMAEFARSGAAGVVCLQPFGCLPNHVTGKGTMRRLRELWPDTGFCAIDYEAGTSHANVSNRLKLFLADAQERFQSRTRASAPEKVQRVIPIHPAGGSDQAR